MSTATEEWTTPTVDVETLERENKRLRTHNVKLRDRIDLLNEIVSRSNQLGADVIAECNKIGSAHNVAALIVAHRTAAAWDLRQAQIARMDPAARERLIVDI